MQLQAGLCESCSGRWHSTAEPQLCRHSARTAGCECTSLASGAPLLPWRA